MDKINTSLWLFLYDNCNALLSSLCIPTKMGKKKKEIRGCKRPKGAIEAETGKVTKKIQSTDE